jgi:hypothetical protein
LLGLLVLLAACAGLAAGCGGSGGGNGDGTTGGSTTTAVSMTKQEVAAAITKICTKGKKRIAKIPFSLGSAGSAANSGQDVADVESDMIDEFKKVQAPDEIKGEVDDFVSKAETARDKLEALVSAAIRTDVESIKSLTAEVASAGADVHDAAKSFGATC